MITHALVQTENLGKRKAWVFDFIESDGAVFAIVVFKNNSDHRFGCFPITDLTLDTVIPVDGVKVLSTVRDINLRLNTD